jgi:HK97 family phage major capsid protein
MEADFSGWATKAGLKCSDGRTIMQDAFKDNDGMRVPLVWQHGHSEATNVLGHALLENRPEGVYAQGFFNETPGGQAAKLMVQHGDITFLSIYANQLVERAKQVFHGAIREVSLVLAGANPGAKIDFVAIRHADGEVTEMEDEAVIFTGVALEHAEDSSGPTVQDVWDSMTQEQQNVVHFMIGEALKGGTGDASHSATDSTGDQSEGDNSDGTSEEDKNNTNEDSLNHQEGTETMTNVFEQNGDKSAAGTERTYLSHDDLQGIKRRAETTGSMRQAVEEYALAHGIDNIDVLFPDARLDQNGISIISRRMEWVQDVLTNTRHSPFSRVKSFTADITAEEARARGYIKGTRKKDEVLKMLRRVTTPKTIYKKQKLDRDDILDITELDIVAWLKAEMRVMLDEELARAILVSDGREVDDEDKIDEDHVRPIAYDDDLYTIKVRLDQAINAGDLTDAVVNAMDGYKGSGNPTLYITQRRLTGLMLQKDTLGRRLYNTKQELANALMVRDIVAVEAMESNSDLIGVIVNLTDYTVGSDRGGDVAMFDDFDIDFNQQKYLIETRVSGALTKPKSAIALFVESSDVVTAPDPTFNATTGVLTVPSQTGVVYLNDDTGATLTAGAQSAIAPGATINVTAAPASGYGLAHDSDREWSFTRDSA